MIRLAKMVFVVAVICQTGPVFGWTLQQSRLMTPWADQVDPQNTLPEYPRPQMVRANWLNLNGVWQYQPGNASDSVPAGQTLTGEILVPFPVESAISGVMQHYDRLWYRRTFTVPAEWTGRRILLHFGAVDWESEVYINGQSAGVHKGGFDSFSYDITPHLTGSGSQELIVRIYDPTNSAPIAVGKQDLNPGGIWYTAVTGIWQTVWLEPVPQASIRELILAPDVDRNRLKIKAAVSPSQPNLTIQATAFAAGRVVGSVSGAAGDELHLTLRQPRLWTPEDPFLYDLTVTLQQGQTVVDQVDSYFGMRKMGIESVQGIKRMTLNDTFVFQIGPLDQGWWPDGLYTAPTDEALKWDLDMIKAFGFNMVRKHVKVEPARWYYWADKLGLLVWQDMPSIRSGASHTDHVQFESEFSEMIREFGNHPSIIMWVVFNEGWGQYDTVRVTESVMRQDPSRIVSCASGWTDYPVGHIIDRHAYPAPASPTPDGIRAIVCGEYGGIGMRVTDHMWDSNSWGYTMVNTGPELAALYDSFVQQLVGYKDNPGLGAGVYTQITDVEVEINGLITYDRRVVKADVEQIRLSNQLYARTFEAVVPTSEQDGLIWQYTTTSPADNWYAADFEDSTWSQGAGGFGTSGTPGSVVGTVWNTPDIWLRRTFDLPALTADQLNRLVFRLHHDEDAQIYLNGILAASVTGYTTSYVHLALNDAAKAALIPSAGNVIAIHCHQTGGGQFIDAGLSLQTISASERCGQRGYPPSDLNRDCRADLEDLAILSAAWMDCSLPRRPECLDFTLP